MKNEITYEETLCDSADRVPVFEVRCDSSGVRVEDLDAGRTVRLEWEYFNKMLSVVARYKAMTDLASGGGISSVTPEEIKMLLQGGVE